MKWRNVASESPTRSSRRAIVRGALRAPARSLLFEDREEWPEAAASDVARGTSRLVLMRRILAVHRGA